MDRRTFLSRSRVRPKRSYRAVIESLRRVWHIQHLADHEAIWRVGAARKKRLPSRPLRLAVWNLCKGAGSTLFEHDFRLLLYQSDLVLAQEALLSERAMQTFCEPGFEVVHGASYCRQDGLRDGIMTVARARAGDTYRRVVCKYPEPIFNTPKAALYNFFALDGSDKPLLVVNVHATLIRTIRGAREEIRHLLGHLPDHDGPMILAGDFNTFTPRYLSAVTDELRLFGLELVAMEKDERSTLSALDQVFVRGLRMRRAVVETSVRSSDHFPLLVDLELI